MSGIMKSISSAVDLAKKALTVGEQFKSVELKATVVDLMEKLLDVRMHSLQFREENATLKSALAESSKGPPLTMRKGLYFREGDPLPFCPGCHEAKNQAIHLAQTPPGIERRKKGIAAPRFQSPHSLPFVDSAPMTAF